MAVSAAFATTNTAVSAINGNYTLTLVRAGTNTVTPSLAGFEFVPTNRVLLLGSNTNIQDFVGTRIFTITGRVTDGVLGVSNVLIIASNRLTGVIRTSSTDSNGSYTVSGVYAGTNIVTATLTGYVFSPASQTVSVSPNVSGINFTGTGVYTLSGRITKSGAPVGSVLVTAGTKQGISDSGGYYIISNLPPRTYTVTPSLAGHVFNPLSRSVTLGPNLNNVDFTAIPVYSLTGRATDGTNGPGLAGVTISAISSAPTVTNTAFTDVNGNYTLSSVPATDNTLTPSRSGYVFNPASQSLTVTTNASVSDFVAVRGYTISGRISEGADGVPGVTVTAAPGSATSDAGGNYIITLATGGSYTVQPATNGIGFNPPSVLVTLSGDRSGVDFTANPVQLTIAPTNGPAKLTLLGVPARTYNIEATTNLVSWQSVSTNLTDPVNGVSEFLDQTATNLPVRVYRTRTP